MLFGGCQGKPRTPTIEEKTCPQCGETIELFSIDSEAKCDNCGFTAYNDSLSCALWCKHAKLCLGPDVYGRMMEIAETQKKEKSQ